MNIAISGASGYIGTHLTACLNKSGHTVIPLRHAMFRNEMKGELKQILNHCDGVINLAGASLNHRWTVEYMRELVQSRIDVTSRLVQAMNNIKNKPQFFISVSAVGYYSTDDMYDESTAKRGDSFLSELCESWEAEAKRCSKDIRLIITRLGVVLSPDGGAMEQMLRPLKALRIAAAIAPGDQSLPWIDMNDLCAGVEFLINHKEVSGIVNLVAPELVSNYVFSRWMAQTYGGFFTITIPEWLLKIIYGKGTSALTLGQQIYPAKMIDAGFRFNSPTIRSFFKTINT